MTYPINGPEDLDEDNIMRATLELDHDQNLIIYAHIIARPRAGIEGEYEFYHSMMMDITEDSVTSMALGGSPPFDNYDDCVLDFNDKLADWVKRRYEKENAHASN